ncbi:MAG TPA: MFS transporter [Gammaproteobacteria bacterium]|nr:MFS transporter [Gammaproteobacteria bacterium]
MTDATEQTNTVDAAVLRRAIGAAAIGNCMEWFDFGVYSYVAAIIGKVFFPSGNTTLELLSSFGTFAVAFLARPFGGFFFGPLGDKIGRQKILAITILMMAGSTFAVGILPGYASIGFWAPVVLVVARLIQGFSTGGEYGGAATFMAEYSPDHRRGFYCSWLAFGTLAGFALGAGLVTIFTFALSSDAMNSWGWRVPFLAAGPLGIVGVYLRVRLEDTPAFKKLEKDPRHRTRAGMKEMFAQLWDLHTRYWRELLIVIGFVVLLNVADYEFLSYMPSYLQHTLHLGEKTGLVLVILIMLVMMVLVVPVGMLTDKLGGKKILMTSCVGFLLLSYPSIRLISSGSIPLAIIGLFIIGMLLVLLLGAQPAVLPAQFPTQVRFAGFAVGYNVSTSAFGGTAPLAVTWLVSLTHDTAVPAYYLIAAAAVAFFPILYMRRTIGYPLREAEA